MPNLNIFPRSGLTQLVLVCTLILCCSAYLTAQTTLSTGSISGTVQDPSGAAVSGAKVTITNIATGQKVELTSNSSGAYNSGPLAPGNYKIQVSAKGFNGMSSTLGVQVGNEASFNPKLQVGQESQVIDVQGSSVQVNTEQAAVQGVLNSTQIENLP